MVETVDSVCFWETNDAAARAYARKKIRAIRARQRRQMLRRVLVAGLTVGGLALAATVARSAAPQSTATNPQTQIITVSAGDTLWTVAGRFGDRALSTSERIEELSALNNGLSGRLIPGQRLIVPIR
jgi:hypothetical protein